MIKKISDKRRAKGEKLCWNSTISAKKYTLKKSPLKKVSDKQAREWKKAREECLEIWGHKCFLCGATKDLHCHHWQECRSQNPARKYDQSNLIILCSKCHSHNGPDKNFYKIQEKIINKLFKFPHEVIQKEGTLSVEVKITPQFKIIKGKIIVE